MLGGSQASAHKTTTQVHPPTAVSTVWIWRLDGNILHDRAQYGFSGHSLCCTVQCASLGIPTHLQGHQHRKTIRFHDLLGVCVCACVVRVRVYVVFVLQDHMKSLHQWPSHAENIIQLKRNGRKLFKVFPKDVVVYWD